MYIFELVFLLGLFAAEYSEAIARFDEAILMAVQMGELDSIKLLLESGRVDPASRSNFLIREASSRGNTAIVAILLKDRRVDPTAFESAALSQATANGHTDVVKQLVDDGRSDLMTDNNYPLRIASKKGFADIFKILLDSGKVDPSKDFNAPLIHASEMRHVEIVKTLLQDPVRVNAAQVKFVPNFAIKWARIKGHSDIVNVLARDTKVAAIEYAEYSDHLKENVFLSMIETKNEWMNHGYIAQLFQYPLLSFFFADLFKIGIDEAHTIRSIETLNTYMCELEKVSTFFKSTRKDIILAAKQRAFLYAYFSRTISLGENIEIFSSMTIKMLSERAVE